MSSRRSALSCAGLAVGDFVIAPFTFNDGTCPACRAGFQSNCSHGGAFGNGETDGGQGEKVRAPLADATLVKVPNPPEGGFTDAQLASFTALSDVTCTGYHAAVSAGVKTGDTVAVVGDGAVGLSAVLAARKLGATRIIALSRHPARQASRRVRRHRHRRGARRRGRQGGPAPHRRRRRRRRPRVRRHRPVDRDLCRHHPRRRHDRRRRRPAVRAVPVPDPVLEERRHQGRRRARPPVHPRALDDVLAGRINPGLVFDHTTDLDHVADAYAAMDERRAIKSLLTVSQP